MISQLFGCRDPLRRAVGLAVVLSLMPLSLAAAGERPASKVGPIKASIEKIGAGDPAIGRTKRAHAAPRARQTGTGRDASFFKSKTGLAALAVMVVGVGYALYSTQNDRITSPGKE